MVDKLTRELIEKAPINVDDLESIEHGLRDEALFRLYQLERVGVFESTLEVRGEITTRIWNLVQSSDQKSINLDGGRT